MKAHAGSGRPNGDAAEALRRASGQIAAASSRHSSLDIQLRSWSNSGSAIRMTLPELLICVPSVRLLTDREPQVELHDAGGVGVHGHGPPRAGYLHDDRDPAAAPELRGYILVLVEPEHDRSALGVNGQRPHRAADVVDPAGARGDIQDAAGQAVRVVGAVAGAVYRVAGQRQVEAGAAKDEQARPVEAVVELDPSAG